MILQLIVVSAELLRAAHIFFSVVLGFLQNPVELGNDPVDFPPTPSIRLFCVESFSSTACRMTEVCSVSSFSICGMIDDRPLGWAVVDFDMNGGIMARTVSIDA